MWSGEAGWGDGRGESVTRFGEGRPVDDNDDDDDDNNCRFSCPEYLCITAQGEPRHQLRALLSCQHRLCHLHQSAWTCDPTA